MLRVGIFRPVGVPSADYALTHAFRGVKLYQQRGYHSARLLQRLWKASNYERADARYPAFLFVVYRTSI